MGKKKGGFLCPKKQNRSLGAAGNLVQPDIHWSSRKFGPAGNSLVQSEIWFSRLGGFLCV
jgi:hypothetical protein